MLPPGTPQSLIWGPSAAMALSLLLVYPLLPLGLHNVLGCCRRRTLLELLWEPPLLHWAQHLDTTLLLSMMLISALDLFMTGLQSCTI